MFSKKTISLLGVSAVGITGTGYHYCAKKNPDKVSNLPYLQDMDCFFLKTKERLESWRKSSVLNGKQDAKQNTEESIKK